MKKKHLILGGAALTLVAALIVDWSIPASDPASSTGRGGLIRNLIAKAGHREPPEYDPEREIRDKAHFRQVYGMSVQEFLDRRLDINYESFMHRAFLLKGSNLAGDPDDPERKAKTLQIFAKIREQARKKGISYLDAVRQAEVEDFRWIFSKATPEEIETAFPVEYRQNPRYTGPK